MVFRVVFLCGVVGEEAVGVVAVVGEGVVEEAALPLLLLLAWTWHAAARHRRPCRHKARLAPLRASPDLQLVESAAPAAEARAR